MTYGSLDPTVINLISEAALKLRAFTVLLVGRGFANF